MSRISWLHSAKSSSVNGPESSLLKKTTFVLNTSSVWLHLTIDNHTQSTRVSCTADSSRA